MTFTGYGGQPIKAWLLLPRRRDGPAARASSSTSATAAGAASPTSGCCGPAAGYAHLVMDTRGQGSVGRNGDTPDPARRRPAYPGFMTRGIHDPAHYYYRRVFTDAVRAVEAAARTRPSTPARVAVTGGSQGGGIALAVAGLVPDRRRRSMPDVPFLCHYRRATGIADARPLPRDRAATARPTATRSSAVFRTLAYFDGVNFAARAPRPPCSRWRCMDNICPPSTVYAAYNHYAGRRKQIEVYEFNDHEGGGGYQRPVQAAFLDRSSPPHPRCRAQRHDERGTVSRSMRASLG